MKIFRFCCVVLLMSWIYQLDAQHTSHYNDNWMFAYQHSFNFTSGTPTYVPGTALNDANIEGVSAISDGFGNVLFYSDAQSVYDANNNPMPNGNMTINGHISSVNASVITKVPNNCNQYYLFTIQDSAGGAHRLELRYSVIDMSLNGGLGDVIAGQSNLLIYTTKNLTEKMVSVQKGLTEDHWIVVRSILDDEFYAFEVTASGVNTNPVTSVVSANTYSWTSSPPITPIFGSFAVSPQNDALLETSGMTNSYWYEFDNLTGIVSNQEVLITSTYAPPSPNYYFGHGCAFSSNGQIIYMMVFDGGLNSGFIYQFDRSGGSGTAAATLQTYLMPQVNAMMHARNDGKIYFNLAGETGLSVIDDPNNYAAPNILVNNYLFPSGVSDMSLANDFRLFNSEIIPSNAAGNDQIICTNQSAVIGCAGCDSITGTYQWEPSAMVTDPNNLVTSTIQLSADQEFTLTVISNCGDTIQSDTVMVTVNTTPIVDLGSDTVLCNGQYINYFLNQYDPGSSFLWMPGSITTSNYFITTANTYSVEVTTNGCTGTDSIVVDYTVPDSTLLGGDTLLCLGEQLVLNASHITDPYVWQNGSTGSTFTATAGGTYYLDITFSNPAYPGKQCRVLKDIYAIDCDTLCVDNLVPNPSFENYSNCPTYLGQLSYAIPWEQGNIGTADYYNQCATGIFSSVPTSFKGHQVPHTGYAYAGFLTRSNSSTTREYVTAQLLSPLSLNTTYRVRYWLNISESSDSATALTGVLFSSGAPIPNPSTGIITTAPSLTYPFPVTDTTNWTEIVDYYTAVGGETHITIGRFNTPSNSVPSLSGGDGNFSCFYYIDDIEVIAMENMTISNDTLICSGNTIALTADSSSSYTWVDSLDLNTVLSTNSVYHVSPLSNTTYAVMNCFDTLYVSVSVASGTTSAASASICQGDSIFLEGSYQSIAGIYTDTMVASTSGCDSLIITTLTVNSVAAITSSADICQGDSLFVGGAYQTIGGAYTDTLSGTMGCDSVVTTNLTVNSVAASTSSADICQGDSLFVGGAYQTIGGAYTDTLSSAAGCDSVVTTSLFIYNPPLIQLTNDTSITLGSVIDLIAYGGNTYFWNTGETTSNISVSPTQTTTYSLIAINGPGCADTAFVTVIVEEMVETELFTPNIFSPNGDGSNDVFYVRGTGFDEFQLIIYNRWGEKVFETEDNSKGWDGTYEEEPLNPGVYVYYVFVRYIIDGKEVNKKGNITLIR